MSVTVPPQLQGHRAMIEDMKECLMLATEWAYTGYSSFTQFEVTVMGKGV